MSKILNYIWLGDAAPTKDLKKLKHMNITHVLSVGQEFPPRFADHLTYLWINDAFDSEDYDLYSHFDEIADFINEAHQKQGVIYVHCAYGISRSSSAVIAYLIKYHKMEYEKAFKLVQNARNLICPNNGFVEQLKKYDQELNKNSSIPKIGDIKLNKKQLKSSKSKVDPKYNKGKTNEESKNEENKEEYKEEYKEEDNENDEILKTIDSQSLVKQQKSEAVNNVTYKCKKCRTILFRNQQIIHEKTQKCSFIFIDQVQWIDITDEQNDKKICCPNCKQNIGKIKKSGVKCTCGEWICPAFQITQKQVEEVKNVDSINSKTIFNKN